MSKREEGNVGGGLSVPVEMSSGSKPILLPAEVSAASVNHDLKARERRRCQRFVIANE